MSELYELPDGWEWKTIKEISNIISGYAFKSKDFSSENEIRSIKITNVGVQNFIEDTDNKLSKLLLEKLSRYTVKENDIVIALTRPYISNGLKVAFVPKDYNGAFVNQRVAAIQTVDTVTNRYIYHYLCTYIILTEVIELSKTLNQPNLSIKDLANFNIPLPPLPEQQRIVSKLDLLFEKIDKSIALHQKNMDEADVFMGSVLNDVFGELEEKYEQDFLNNYCKITSSKRVYKSDYVENGIIFYRIKDIVLMSKNLPITDSQYIKKEAFDEFDKKFGSPKSGDILLTAVGATLGYAYLVTNNDTEFYFKDGNILWLKNINNLDRKYLLHIFKSPLFDQYLDKISKGAAQPAITIIKLKEFNIPIPPLIIQHKTVKYLDKISEKTEKIKQVQKEKMQNLIALKASILDQAFRGKL